MNAARTNSPTAVATRLWNLCSFLRDDGIVYHQYLTELTYLLYLKLASELGTESAIPKFARWSNLVESESPLAEYRHSLAALGRSRSKVVSAIFDGATTQLTSDERFEHVLRGLDTIDLSSLGSHALGDLYENLIERGSQEARSGAGQYFTPRDLVHAIVDVLRPSGDDVVFDPAAGTGGFLVAAGSAALAAESSVQPRLIGVEIADDVRRLAMANLALHQIEGEVTRGDALALTPPACTVCATNPPFGTKSRVPSEQQVKLEFPTANKQLAFIQHVWKSLKSGGRAAVVVPDNVLFEAGVARAVRERLLDGFNLHTVLRLPQGIFYATGVKTSVLFFAKPSRERPSTTSVIWAYDLRQTNHRDGTFGRGLRDFVKAYGSDPLGGSTRRRSSRFSMLERETLGAELRLDLTSTKQAHSGESTSKTVLDELDILATELEVAQDALSRLRTLLSAQDVE